MTRPARPADPSVKAGGVKIFSFRAQGDDTPRRCNSTTKEKPPAVGRGKPKSEIADQISGHLRSLYDDVLNQPVPGRFLELLRQLESDTSEDDDSK